MRYLLLFLFLLLPALCNSEIVDRIVAIVNEEIITLGDVEEFVEVEKAEKIKSIRDYFLGLKLREKLELLIEDRLIRQEAKRMGIEVGEGEIDQVVEGIKRKNLISDDELKENLKRENISYESFRQGIRDAIIRERVISRMVTPELNLDDRKLREYYDLHKDEFKEEEVRLRQVFISGVREDSRERAKKALSLIIKGVPFEEVAKEYSDEPSGKYGGDIGFVKKNDLIPELRDALKGKAKGEITDIIRSPYGYHILRLEEIKGGNPPPFDEVKEEIKRRLILEESQKRYREFVEKLKRKSYIEIKL